MLYQGSQHSKDAVNELDRHGGNHNSLSVLCWVQGSVTTGSGLTTCQLWLQVTTYSLCPNFLIYKMEQITTMPTSRTVALNNLIEGKWPYIENIQ